MAPDKLPIDKLLDARSRERGQYLLSREVALMKLADEHGYRFELIAGQHETHRMAAISQGALS